MFPFPRDLTRRHRTDPAVGSLLAGGMAGSIREFYGHTVTFVPEDLVYVERLFSELRTEDGFVGDEFTLQSLGCLIGEVLVQADGGRWSQVAHHRGAPDHADLEVVLPNGHTVDPFQAAHDCADGGDGSSVIRFRQLALAS